MAGEKLVRRAIQAARETLSPEELLMGIHNTRSGRGLEMIEKLGGLPAPSIAVTKPAQGYTSFGDISLVAPVEMVTPGRKTPAFGSDVYSPRFPSVEDDQIFRGFTPSGKRRYAPVTMENVLREMKGPVRGGESWNYGPASIRAQVTPQFGSLPEMQAAREKIIPASEFGAQKEISNEMMERLRERFEPYFKPADSYRRSWSAFPEALTDFARTGRPSEFAYDYKDLPAEALTEARSFLGHLRDMPTEYFEVKPQRGVPLGEFAGAVVPGDVPGEVVDRLRRLGVGRIEEYGDEASRRDALMKFVGEQGFAEGGEVREGFQKGGRLITEALDLIRKLPPAENSRLTQIATTGPSYKKALSHLERAGIEGRAIDYGAGRGHGLREIGADTFEPYPQGWSPTYTKPEEIPDEVYRRLVNLNVLNVLDPQARESAVLNMGRIVEPGGGGVISTRGRDVMSARGEPGPEPMSLIIGEGDSARYQKGFTPRELREYVGDTLGPRFDVEPSDVGQASIMFRRNREDGGRLLEDEYPSQYLPNVGRQVMADGGMPEFPMSEGERNAQLNDAIAYADRLSRAERMGEARTALAQTWPVQMAKSIVGGLALPGDVAAGRVDPTSEIGVQRALDLAGLATFGPSIVPGSGVQGAINMSLLDPSKRRPGGPFDPTLTGSVFKDVKYPDLTRGQNRAINSAIEMGRMEEVDLPIRSMYATQKTVNPDFASPVSSNRGNLPVVQRIGDEFFVRDGHHRLTKLAMEGKDVARVNLVDPYGSTPKDMPLLEWRPKTSEELALAAKEKAAIDSLYDDLAGYVDDSRALGGFVSREEMADGGEPTAQSRRRETLEQLGAFEDRPPMDPAVMGENWANAVRRFRERPIREGEATVRPLELGARDVIGGAIAGDGGITRSRIADIVAGSRGLPGSGTLGMGLADVTPAGIPLAISDFSDALRNEDYLSAGLSAGLPAAYYARKPIMAAGRAVYDAGARAVDAARDVLGRVPAPVAAGAAGAAVMTPEEAEAAKLDAVVKAARKAASAAPSRPDLFDYSRLGDVPHVRQFDLPRYEPARGVPSRVVDMIANKDVRDEMLKTIEQGERMGGSRWYNADPLRDRFVEQFGRDRGDEAFRKYMDFVAATSPRSEVGSNVRNASYYYNRAMTGQGMPAVGERNPQPYGHMAQRLHQINAERVAGEGWDPLNNPKPASFVENLVGNQQPVTVDTHAFRLPAIIARDPRFLETAFQVDKTAPKQNIAKMIESGEISMDDAAGRAAYWQPQPKANEYAAMEQYYKSLGRDLGLTPAQTQAAAWVGGGARTGLKSDESKPFLRFVEDRIYKTAEEKNMDPQDVMRLFVRGEMPLYANGGSVSDRAITLAKELGSSPRETVKS